MIKSKQVNTIKKLENARINTTVSYNDNNHNMTTIFSILYQAPLTQW